MCDGGSKTRGAEALKIEDVHAIKSIGQKGLVFYSIYIVYVHPMLKVALLMFFPSSPIFCLSWSCRIDKSCNTLSSSSLLPTSSFFSHSWLPFCWSLSTGCHNILRVTCPGPSPLWLLYLNNIIRIKLSILFSDGWTSNFVPKWDFQHSVVLWANWSLIFKYLVVDHVSDPYVIVGRTHWL